jgi:LPS-assembly protein
VFCPQGQHHANVTHIHHACHVRLGALPMICRTRFLITSVLLCHWFVALPLVTSQLRAPDPQESVTPDAPSALDRESVTIRSQEQEMDGPVYKLRGQVQIQYGPYTLYADEITYNRDTGDAIADGHVLLEGTTNNEHLRATHGTYNTRTETGKFENVVGTIGLGEPQKRLVLTSQNPFYFTGKFVEKTGPDHYIVHGGTVTTCQLPRPKWQFSASRVTVDVAGDAKIYNSTFRIGGVPILFLPFATHPVVPQRKSGFLVPTIGNSSRKGLVFGESVYWVMNRTMDLQAGTEYFSKRGWAPQGEFRARPSEQSFVDLNFYSVFDRGILQPDPNTPPNTTPRLINIDQGGTNVRLDAESRFHNFRAVANIDYLSSYVFRLAFNEVFTAAVNSEVKSQAFLTKTINGYSSNLLMQRYQNFESTTKGDVITILHAPSLDLSSVEHRIGPSPFYWSYDASAEGLSRSEPSFNTGQLVGRFDFYPRISLPLLLHGWSVRAMVGARDTLYTKQLVANPSTVGMAVDNPINRRDLEGSLEIRPPSLERVFGREILGRKWKHVVEPRVIYRYVTGINNFDHILRFDARDILSNTNEVEYAIINRLYAKRVKPRVQNCEDTGMPSFTMGGALGEGRVVSWNQHAVESDCSEEPPVREIVTWELAQKYFIDPTFGGALVPGTRNVFTTTADLTGIAFLTEERRLSPLLSRLRFQTTSRTGAEWDLDYDIKKGRINSSAALVDYRFGPFTVGGGDAFLRLPGENMSSVDTQLFNQFRILLGYGGTNKRGFSAAANVGIDANKKFLQYASAQTTYNWDCCGFSVEYRRFALGQVRNENQFRFTFSLANIGSFGNLGRRERLF